MGKTYAKFLFHALLAFSLCYECVSAGVKTPLKSTSLHLSHFTFDIVRRREPNANMVISPGSLEACLGMLLKGAGGSTERELRKALHLGNSTDDQVHAELSQLLNYLESKPKDRLKFRAANMVLVSKQFPLKQDYVQFVNRTYHGSVISEDFKNALNDPTRDANKFVQTNAKGETTSSIKKSFSTDTKLAVVHTAMFTGRWATPFNPLNTRKAAFYNVDRTVTQVDMMHVKTSLSTCRLPESNGMMAEIKFTGDARMIVFVADDRYGYGEGINWLTGKSLGECLNNLRPDVYDLYMPKYTLDYELDMQNILEKMQIDKMFNATQANFTGISDTPGLYVSSFVNKMAVRVNEIGVNAGDANSVNSPPLAGNDNTAKVIRLDRPFGYGIMDEDKRVLLAVIVNKL